MKSAPPSGDRLPGSMACPIPGHYLFNFHMILIIAFWNIVERMSLRKVYNLRSSAFVQIITCQSKLKLCSKICALLIINPFTVIWAMFLTEQIFLFRTLVAVCNPAFELHARVWSARKVRAPGRRHQRVFEINNFAPSKTWRILP